MGGTACEHINRALRGIAAHESFFISPTSQTQYQKWAQEPATRSILALNEDQANLSARFPRNVHEFAQRALSQCRAVNILDSDHYDKTLVEHHLRVLDDAYVHGNYMSYIFPEESALLYAITRIAQPGRVAVLGSFYGYWAVSVKAAVPTVALTLVDLNPAVMALAQRNFKDLGMSESVEFCLEDAEVVSRRLKIIDLLVLDAEGPDCDEVPSDYRDKAIYYPHLLAALPNLSPGALVVAHNVILSNFTGGTYFERKQRRYREQYTKFLDLLRQHFVYTVIDSTEGLLVARKL